MQIRKFTAENYSEALRKVKEELGGHALVLTTRTLPAARGPGRSAGKPWVEITAAVDHSATEFPPASGDADPARAGGANPKDVSRSPLEPDTDLKPLILALLSQTDKARSIGLKNHQFETYRNLVENGVDERFAGKLFERINGQNGVSGGDARQEIKQLGEMMKRLIVCEGAIRPGPRHPRLVAMVGPTGAGKTTTIAKLAARFALREKKKVAMISLDTFRIGAVDQLRIYGEIMRVPVEIAGTPADFSQAVDRHADKDIILIDTLGKSHRDSNHCRALREIFRAVKEVETHLVLNVSTHEKVWEETFRQYSLLPIQRVLFSKLDEGVIFGSLFNFALKTQVPLSYFTTGQKVPEDIEEARKDQVIRLIFNANKAKLTV